MFINTTQGNRNTLEIVSPGADRECPHCSASSYTDGQMENKKLPAEKSSPTREVVEVMCPHSITPRKLLESKENPQREPE